MDQLGITAFIPHPPPSAFVIPWRTRLCLDDPSPRQRAASVTLSGGLREGSRPGGGEGEQRQQPHSEQKAGFKPPSPLEDDGFRVDMAELQDLVESGALQVAKRPADYADRRTDGYTEPLELYVLGTSHVSDTSAANVRRVLQAVRPQSVVVELCKSRAGLMMPVADDAGESNPLGMSGESFASSLARSIRIGGQSTALLRAALAWVARGSMSDGGGGGGRAGAASAAAAMYSDFRAAKEGAEEAEAQIVLGDRPVEVTLKRAWEALSFGERWDLARSLVQLAFRRGGGGGGSDEGNSEAAELRRSVSDGEVGEDVLEGLITMLAERFPSVVGPLIYERDLYLAWTLKRSRAVCGQRRVVGVVGRGHLAGVMRAVEADRGGDTLVFRKLAGKEGGRGAPAGGGPGEGRPGGLEWPYSSRPSNLERGARFAARLGIETAAGFALWELYKAVTTTSA